MNAIDSIAGGDVTKYEGVLLMPYATIRIKLQMNLAQRIYQKKLRNVLTAKNKK
jgi:hypothetical protein